MTIREPGRFIRLALMTVSPCFIASHSSAKNAEEWGTPLYTWFGVAAGIGGPPGELRSLESTFDFAQGRLGRLSPNGYRGWRLAGATAVLPLRAGSFASWRPLRMTSTARRQR